MDEEKNDGRRTTAALGRWTTVANSDEGRGRKRWTKDDRHAVVTRTMDEKTATNKIRSVRDLAVYRTAFDSAMEIFEISKTFPKGEMYSLTDQIRRSSRSVCSALSEGWRKRRYKAVFLNKLSDAGEECAETQTWLEFALRCNYIDKETFRKLDDCYEHIFAMVANMEKKVDAFCKQ